jgi:hypothetical protein
LLGDAQHSLVAMGAGQLDYETVKRNLTALFTSSDLLRTGKVSAFMGAQRFPGESFPVFAMRLTGLAACAFGNMAERDKMIMSKLIETVPDEMKAQVTVQLASMPNPTLDNVVQVVSALEPFFRKTPSSMPVRSVEVQHTLARSEARGASSSRVDFRSRDRGRETGAVRKSMACFFCNEVGHFARNCPKRKGAEMGQFSSRDSQVLCQYCCKKGHVLAHCDDFKKEFGSCVWCGATDHKSFKCGKRPSGN